MAASSLGVRSGSQRSVAKIESESIAFSLPKRIWALVALQMSAFSHLRHPRSAVATPAPVTPQLNGSAQSCSSSGREERTETTVPTSAATEESRKLKFMADALSSPWPAQEAFFIEPDLQEALDWVAARSPDEVMRAREEIICAIEARAAHLRASGAVEAWMSEADDILRGVAAGVNGPLLEELASITDYHDAGSIGIPAAYLMEYGYT